MVEEWPLAFCDGKTVKRDDLVASDNIRSKYIGENLFARYSPDYKWHYLSDQAPDEVTLLKIFDSADGVVKRSYPHFLIQAGLTMLTTRQRHPMQLSSSAIQSLMLRFARVSK
jgi:hypothetical protein